MHHESITLQSFIPEFKTCNIFAVCHLFFNISGILIFYPIPQMRRIPIRLARGLGNTTAEYRWFAIAYLIVCFGCIPILVFGLSLAGWRVFVGVTVPIVVIGLFVGVVTVMQRKCSGYLPKCLRTWEWVPACCRSLKPYDKLFSLICLRMCRKSGGRDSMVEQKPYVPV